MTAPPTVHGLAIGRNALRALHASLLTQAPDQAVAMLQEIGYAWGDEVYQNFCAWLPGATGLDGPEDLDGASLSSVLSDFFQSQGWGELSVEPLGGGALALDSRDWAEAEPGTAEAPMCFLSSGLLADFLGRLSGEPVAVMEVECRCKNDPRCRFLSATPERLQQVYDAMMAGRSYLEALNG